jgi:hypothetical protein
MRFCRHFDMYPIETASAINAADSGLSGVVQRELLKTLGFHRSNLEAASKNHIGQPANQLEKNTVDRNRV